MSFLSVLCNFSPADFTDRIEDDIGNPHPSDENEHGDVQLHASVTASIRGRV